MFCGVCCFSTFLRGTSAVRWSRDCIGCQGSSGQLCCVPLSLPQLCVVCCGLHLAYAQPFPWSRTEAEASSLSVYSVGLAGPSQTLKRNKQQTVLKVLFLNAKI